MQMYHNIILTGREGWCARIITPFGLYTSEGFGEELPDVNSEVETGSRAEAAWQADKARYFFQQVGLLTRIRAYNFPERVEHESEWLASPQDKRLLAFVKECESKGFVPHPLRTHAMIEDEKKAFASAINVMLPNIIWLSKRLPAAGPQWQRLARAVETLRKECAAVRPHLT